MPPFCGLALLALWFGAISPCLGTAGLTGLAAARAGNQFIPPQAKDEVTAIYSEKTQGGLDPAIWRIDYFDPSTSFKTTEVEFTGGKVTKISQPKHVLHLLVGVKKLNWRKMKIDSDQALATALKDPVMKGFQLEADQFWLRRSPTDPIWEIRFWATRLGHPGKTMKIGQIFISARDGMVVKNELLPGEK
jgi:hypothetical protein